MAHKAETAVQGWSVDPMESVFLTHTRTRTHKELSWDVIIFLLLWSSALLSVLVLISLLLSFSVQFCLAKFCCRIAVSKAIMQLIPKTIGNRKRDCA